MVSVSSKKARPAFRMAGSAEDRFFWGDGPSPAVIGEAVVAGGAPDLGDMRLAIAVQVMSGDLDDVEAELGDLFDVFQAVGAPFLFPVRVVDAELHLRLQGDERIVVARELLPDTCEQRPQRRR